ncbi:MAG: hypothetical protein JNM27_13885 [Leptospirales bacterium]|nr:hypothetical protein [Leptospirales bacterium]
MKRPFYILCFAWITYAPLLHAAPLDFSSYIRLKEGSTFKIRNGNELIGKGKLIALSKTRLHFQFEISAKGQSIKADATLAQIQSDARDYIIELSYKGNVNAKPENAKEQVRADKFLAENGILTFHFLKNERFFQLARNKKGESTITTDWGTGTIVPDKK